MHRGRRSAPRRSWWRGPKHRGLNLRSVLATLVVAGTATTTWLFATGTQAPATAATVTSSASCRTYDPNLVSGVCLTYIGPDNNPHFTWLGTYRAANGKVFFCIDFRYDSTMAGAPRVISTANLKNQLGRSVGAAEVAALNYLIGRWAPHGSTGDANRDAAIAMLIREVMSDGVSENGVVYPPGLKVGGLVQDPIGGLGGTVMALAKSMWSEGSAFRGPWKPRLTFKQTGTLPVGAARSFDVSLVSAAGRMVGGETVTFACTGPIVCPKPVISGGEKVRTLSVTPTNVGPYTITASTAAAPSAQGLLYDVGWSSHSGSLATNSGPQRGWIAMSNTEKAGVAANSVAVLATPKVVTTSSVALATGQTALFDSVTVTGLPAGFTMTTQATLWGPFVAKPTATSCVGTSLVRTVSLVVKGNGTFRTPTIMTRGVGYYTWTNAFPKTAKSVAVTTPCGVAAETTRIVPHAPKILTQANVADVVGDAALYDNVTVSGLPTSGYVGTVAATLWGPFATRPTTTSCVASSKVGTVSLAVTKNGTYKSPTIKTRGPGYYVWTEELPNTAMVAAGSSPCGIAAETTLRWAQPRIATTASTQASVPGDSIFDTYVVSSADGIALTGVWSLLGPVAPVAGSCGGVDWSAAAIADSGTIAVPGDGTYRTESTVVAAAGCYTYQEHLDATTLSKAVDSPPGQASETVLVGVLQPGLATQISSQRSTRGDSVHDTVVVTGTGLSHVVVEWSLLGPVEPKAGSCADVSWVAAPVAASGTFATKGDGTYVTEPVTLSKTGCYTYIESAAHTSRTVAAATPPGQPSETTIVTVRQPAFRTQASQQRALTGSSISDAITVTGMAESDRIEIQWSLLGPIAPNGTTCRDLDWSGAVVARRGQVTARGSGVVHTPSVRIDKPGCYTYQEAASETVTTGTASSPPGLPSETVMVTQPPLPVIPPIPTGLAGATPSAWVNALLQELFR